MSSYYDMITVRQPQATQNQSTVDHHQSHPDVPSYSNGHSKETTPAMMTGDDHITHHSEESELTSTASPVSEILPSGLTAAQEQHYGVYDLEKGKKETSTVETREVDASEEKQPGPLQSSEDFLPDGGVAHLAKHSFFFYWWQEICATIIMLIALAGIILVLGLHNGKPLPKWPYSITPNSLISTLVTVMKAMMLAVLASGLSQTKWLWFKEARPLEHYSIYDKASQGPKMASQLLWVLGGRQFLATLAALVIMVAIALDPFTQQVIHYELRTYAAVGANTTLPRTSIYAPDGALHNGAGSSTILLPVLSAMSSALYTPNSDSYDITASNCYTGNCTFDKPYSTIGLCSKCKDTSADLVGKCHNVTLAKGDIVDEPIVCKYSLPSGTSLSTADLEYFVAANQQGDAFGLSGSFEWDFISRSQSYPACSQKSDQCNTCRGTGCTDMLASRCALYPCIKIYTAEVSIGNLTETVIDEVPLNMDPTNVCYTHLKTSCLSSHDWKVLENNGFVPPSHNLNASSSTYPAYLDICNITGFPAYLKLSPSCIWDFSSQSATSYMSSFDPLLNGSLQGVYGYDFYGPVGATGPSDLLTLYNYGAYSQSSVSQTFAAISRKLTSLIRTTYTPIPAGTFNPNVPADGTIWVSQTVISVQWAWLALPLLLVLFTLIFFIGTVIETSISGREPYQKTFSLALLLSGVAGSIGDGYADLKYLHEIEQDVKAMVRTESGREKEGGKLGKLGRSATGEQGKATVEAAKGSRVQMCRVGEEWKLVKV